MNSNSSYRDIQALIERARLERSAALGDAIGTALAAIWKGSKRLGNATMAAASMRRTSAHPNPALVVPAHR